MACIVKFNNDADIFKKNQACHLNDKTFRYIQEDQLKEKKFKDLTQLKKNYKEYSWPALPSIKVDSKYWVNFLKILSSLPNDLNMNLEVKKKRYEILLNSSKIAMQCLENRNKIIPETPLRELYKQLGDDPAATLIKLFSKSIKQLEDYKIDEDVPFRPGSKCSDDKSKLKDTQKLQKFFFDNEIIDIEKSDKTQYKYLFYEMPTLRATEALYENGGSGRKSGLGGIDILCFNKKTVSPVLIEYKSKSDKSLFYALVQLLTYASELSTISQKKRFNAFVNKKLEGKTEWNGKAIELCILYDYTKKREKEIAQVTDVSDELMRNKNISKYISLIAFIELTGNEPNYTFKMVHKSE